MKALNRFSVIALCIASNLSYCQILVPEQRMTMDGQKWGYKNPTTGEKVTKALYDAAYDYHGNYAVAKKGEKLGYINSKGKEITPFKYDKAEDFVNGFAKIQIGTRLGFIDSTGKEICDLKYIRLRNFQEGYATASEEDLGRTGFIDKNGKPSSRFYFDNAGSYNEGYVWVELRGKVGFLNKNGDEIIKPKYDWVTDFKNGISIVMKKQIYGVIDKQGREFIPIIYPKVTRFGPDSSLILVQNKENKVGLFNKAGKVILPEYFVKISDYENLDSKLLSSVYRVPNEIFFYIDETGKCIEFNNKPCPEE